MKSRFKGLLVALALGLAMVVAGAPVAAETGSQDVVVTSVAASEASAAVALPAVAMVSLSTQVSCADEGYTGTKLEWCRNICERGYTGGTLDMWIRRWVDRYRQLPACALD